MVSATVPLASFRIYTASAWVSPASDSPFTSRIWSPRLRDPSRAAAPRSKTLFTYIGKSPKLEPKPPTIENPRPSSRRSSKIVLIPDVSWGSFGWICCCCCCRGGVWGGRWCGWMSGGRCVRGMGTGGSGGTLVLPSGELSLIVTGHVLFLKQGAWKMRLQVQEWSKARY